MSYGVEIKNSNGQVQIDSTYINFMKYETGSISLSSNYHTNVPFTNYSGGPPAIAFKLLSDSVTIGYVYQSAGNWASFDVHHQPSIGTLNYVIWRDLPLSSPSGYGLAIYNASGSVVFNINDIAMKMVGSYSSTLDGIFGQSTAVSVQDANNNYFMLFPFSTGTYVYYASSPYFWHARVYRGIEKVNATSINVINDRQDLGRTPVSVADMSAWTDAFTVVELSL